MQKTNLNVSPIFDDFDENKNFHRVLFNAGKSVQARELTQAQTILQSQIERMGKHLFTEGSMVVPGGVKAVQEQDYIKMTMAFSSTYADINGVADLHVRSNLNGLIAKVAKTFDVVNSDPVTAFVDVLTPGSNQEKSFAANETVTFFVYNTNGTFRDLAIATVTGKGQGSWVKVQNGVYFVRGMFVKTEDQDYVISKYTVDTTIKVGFKVIEEIVTAAQDISLYSNANGFPNQNAEGASRLKITLQLVGLAVNATDKDFIEIARFEEGELTDKIDYTNYALIEQAIARRTYETHGDYIINEYGIDVKEHLKTGNNGGVFTAANGGDETKLVASIKPGVGYVKGYRIENVGTQNVPFLKARDSAFLNNATFTADYGQYFVVNTVKSMPDIDIKKQILLLDSTTAQVGTARVRAIRKDGANHRVYVFDIAFNSGKSVNNVASIKYTDASSLFTANLVSSVLYDSARSSLLFPMPVTAIKSLAANGSDTSYTVLRSFTLTTNGSGVVTTSVGANEFFAAVDNINYFIGLTGSANVGTLFDPLTSVTLGGTILGTNATINLGAGQANKTIKFIAPVIKSATVQKSKTLLTVTDEVVSFTSTNIQKLSKVDIYDIVSVKDNTTSEDVTSQFYLYDNGQKDSWYEQGKIGTVNSQLIIKTVKVTYRYFSHSAGDYFSVDSYAGLTRSQIPSYNGVNLSDYIDFRPVKDAAGNFTASTVTGEVIMPGNTVRADVTYYLPRTDIVCVTAEGLFKVMPGISSLSPTAPEVPFDAMKLYELYVPAYTEDVTKVAVKSVDNRRYTMRDIGKLEGRIANIEYYTTLSALESATNKTEVLDPVTGNNRFKNGFAVDGFKDFRMADVENPEFSASMDIVSGELKPQFVENGVDFTASSTTYAVKPGRVYMKSYSEVLAVQQPYATMAININPYAVFAWMGNVTLTPDRDYWRDVRYNDPIVLNNTIDLRAGAVQGSVWSGWIKTTYDELGGHRDWRRLQQKQIETITTFQEQTFSSSTDDLVSTTVEYFMRSIPILFQCRGFRPYTRIYPFFDSVEVSAECKPWGGNFGDALITDSAGAIDGIFQVPARADKRFKTGTSSFRFSDSPTDSREVGASTTEGQTIFLSGGLTDTRQTTTTNTTVLTATSTQGGVRYIDPIAQTFMVPGTGGSFVTGFDIFFASRARFIPVTLELRTAYAGLPTSDVLGSVTLNPGQVNTSGDGSVATAFKFADPIYLEEGREYAVVLMADTQEYNVFIAQMGQNVIGSPMALSKQAYMGVFLTSANGSTWNADQAKDLKFNVYRAAFNTAPSTIVFDCTAPEAVPLDFNAIATTTGSANLKVTLKSHGLKVGDSVTIAGAIAGNGISATTMNATKTVTATTIDTFTVVASSNATSTGSIGGSAMTAQANYPFNILVNNVDQFAPTGTSVTWEYQYTTQANRIKSGWKAFGSGVSIYAEAEAVIRQAGDLQIRATLNTTKDNVSPMIESSGFNAVMVSPRIDAVEKVFNYVSTDIKFDKPTTQAKFYVGAKLPGNSGMKFYIKEFDTPDQTVADMPWVELGATNPISNSESYIEYEYNLTGSFIGYKIKIELTGVTTSLPSLSDVRTLAFA